jgi:NADH-quinone oxidoreductase subunit F
VSSEILEKIKQAGLVGRGGAAVPVYKKWLRVGEAQAQAKIVVCNAAEGEPGVRKDIHLMENSLELVFEGMKLALDFLGSKNAYFFVKEKSRLKIETKLNELVAKYKTDGYDIKVFIAPPKYVAGERNTMMSAIEGKILQPIVRQPSASINGINGQPTLVQNVETFYNIAQAVRGEYQNKRFASINKFDENGTITELGVYEVDNDASIKKILEKGGHWPSFPFFVQVGGNASGKIFNSKQMETETLTGSGSIDIIPTSTKPRDLLLRWFKFFSAESCGKCAPCFKGSAELYKIVTESQEIPWEKVLKLSYVAKKASFCGLGKSIAIPVESFVQNIVFAGSKVEKGELVKETETSQTPNQAASPASGSDPASASPTPSPLSTSATPATINSMPTTLPTPTPAVGSVPTETVPAPISTPAPAAPEGTVPAPTPTTTTKPTEPTRSDPATKPKIKVGLFTFTCSEDSTIMLTVLMNDYLLEWKKRIEFVEARVLRKHRPGALLDVSFVEGSITSEDQVPKLLEIRKRSKNVIAIGSCACSASPAGLRNKFDDETKVEIDCVLKRFKYADKVRKIADVVPIDGQVPGCPMNTKIFLKLLNKVFVEYGFEPVEIIPETVSDRSVPPPAQVNLVKKTADQTTTPAPTVAPTAPVAPAVPPVQPPPPIPIETPTSPPDPQDLQGQSFKAEAPKVAPNPTLSPSTNSTQPN